IYARLLLMVPRRYRPLAQQFLNDVTGIFVRYLRGLLVVCALNGIATALILAMFRVPNALALGAISGVMYMVPYLGAAITIAVTAGICLMSSGVQMTLVIVKAAPR